MLMETRLILTCTGDIFAESVIKILLTFDCLEIYLFFLLCLWGISWSLREIILGIYYEGTTLFLIYLKIVLYCRRPLL